MSVIENKMPAAVPVNSSRAATSFAAYERLRLDLENQYADLLCLDRSLDRKLVSFQANKSRPVYRWFKYKEGFSACLVESLLHRVGVTEGTLLDPFAGSGTAMFVAAQHGLAAEGIELLPIGQAVIDTRRLIERGIPDRVLHRLAEWITTQPWKNDGDGITLSEVRITRGAYSPQTATALRGYLAALVDEDAPTRNLLRFALLCILESISFTRKDGQYLRWDHRSGRSLGGKPFDKGHIPAFEQAITAKLKEILHDLQTSDTASDLFTAPGPSGSVKLHHGSCLEILPTLGEERYDCVFTSPPYCNRYDYTRTYALELALLGVDEAGFSSLRQTLLSATVENRPKHLLAINPRWRTALDIVDQHPPLGALFDYLDAQLESRTLNNTGIPRMIRGYFTELACVIQECSRVLKPGCPLVMVNDNVRFAGACIPVDLILTQIAEQLGFRAEVILVLPTGKGNSSQQMGQHGRDELRKCVYVWRKA